MIGRRNRPIQGPVRQQVQQFGNKLLQGVETTGTFSISVRDSVRVIHAARAGAAHTILATASQPASYPTFDSFNAALFPRYERIGANVLREFGAFTYNLNYHVVLTKPNNPPIETTFLIYPVYNQRVVMGGSQDFRQRGFTNELVDQQFHEFANKYGSGITLDRVTALELQFIKTGVPHGRGGSYFPVNYVQLCCINVENHDEECFKYAILSALHYSEVAAEERHRPESYLPFVDQYNWDGIEFPAHFIEDPHQFEEMNPNIAVHVWQRQDSDLAKWEDGVPIYVSPRLKVPGVRHVDLYLADNGEDLHYMGITSLPEFAIHNAHDDNQRDRYMCRLCLRTFREAKTLDSHYKLQSCHVQPKTVLKPLDPAKTDVVGFVSHAAHRATLFGVIHAEERGGKVYFAYQLRRHGYTHPFSDRVLFPDPVTRPVLDPERLAAANPAADLLMSLHAVATHWRARFSSDKDRWLRINLMTTNSGVLKLLAGGGKGVDLKIKKDSLEFGDVRIGDGTSLLKKVEVNRDLLLGLNEYCVKWDAFRNFSLQQYHVDAGKFYSMGVFGWHCAMTHKEPGAKLVSDPEMFTFIESAKRGGINIMAQRSVTADNVTKYLAYFDINSSYGYAMLQPLPHSNFKWIAPDRFTTDDILSLADDGDEGYFLKVDLSSPDSLEWHNEHADLPFAPHHYDVNGKERYVCSHLPKRDYVVHYRLLKFYLQRGLVLEWVTEVLAFTQKRWLKPFAELQQTLRNEGGEFAGTLKVMTNSVFGFSCTNPRNKQDYREFDIRTDKGATKFARYALTSHTLKVYEGTPGIITSVRSCEDSRPEKPMYVGVTILELGKLFLYQSFYDKLRVACKDVRLVYSDTDSLMVTMANDPLQFMEEKKEWFDSTKFGTLKEESDGRGVSFIGSRPKHYMYVSERSSRVRNHGADDFPVGKDETRLYRNVNDNTSLPYGHLSC